MKVVIPNALELLSCSVSESDAVDGAEWVSSATYGKGDKVRHLHYSYESLAAENIGNNPAETYQGISAKWKPLGATMPWRMLDDKIETQTVGTEGQPLSFSVPFNRATALGLLNIVGGGVDVTVTDTDDGEVLFEQSYTLVRDISEFSLWEYNYTYIEAAESLVISSIVMPITGVLSVTVTPGESEAPAVGKVIVGREHFVGLTLYDAEVGELDYSKKETNELGITTFVRGSYASELSLPIYLHPDRADAVKALMRDVRARPCLWLGDNRDYGYESLILYGWKEDFRNRFAGPNECSFSLDLQGLI